ncbi:MAG: hypothetical protein LQ351_005854 [Letrouitia transgressa]|nr:MAG: hypothetical protein LQ351_005854 [Letrouitia transgressa]
MDTPPTASASPAPRPISPVPLDSSLRTHLKRFLPESLSSTYPHGLLSGHPRTTEQQEAFEARKAEVRHSMTKNQMEKAYEDVTERIRELMEQRERMEKEVEKRIEVLKAEREVERRVLGKFKGRKGGAGGVIMVAGIKGTGLTE